MKLRDNIIEQIEQFVSDGSLSISNVCFFMQSIRVLMEIDDSSSKFKVTAHYCNWILHKELDRSHSPQIIEDIANSFNIYNSKNDLINRITQAISLKKLVSELKEILSINLQEKGSFPQIHIQEYWLAFLQIILNQIKFRPLKLKTRNIDLDNLELSIYGVQIIVAEHYCIELLSKELEKKDRRLIFDIALFPED